GVAQVVGLDGDVAEGVGGDALGEVAPRDDVVLDQDSRGVRGGARVQVDGAGGVRRVRAEGVVGDGQAALVAVEERLQTVAVKGVRGAAAGHLDGVIVEDQPRAAGDDAGALVAATSARGAVEDPLEAVDGDVVGVDVHVGGVDVVGCL